MLYEQELLHLIEKLDYWTKERIQHFFYAGFAPITQKYGKDWSQVWEETDLGLVLIHNRFKRKFKEIILYAKDGKIYKLNEYYGDHDWDIWRELYVKAHETGEFRLEVPFYYQLIPVNGVNWAFSVSMPPGGELGTNIYETWMGASNGSEFLNQLVFDIEALVKNLKPIVEKYNVGMSSRIFCPIIAWNNNGGRYFMEPGDYNMSYSEAVRHGIAMAKIAQTKKISLFNGLFAQNIAVSDVNVNDVVDLIKERWKE
jgi:hypothetical protein